MHKSTHEPDRGSYEAATDWCVSGPIPGKRHTPSGTYAGSTGHPVEEYDWEPDPDKPGYRRIIRGDDGKPTVKRDPDTRRQLAMQLSQAHIDALEPTKHVVKVVRRQVVEVEVEAYSAVEATWAALAEVDDVDESEWSEPTWTSGFHSRVGDQLEGHHIAVGPV